MAHEIRGLEVQAVRALWERLTNPASLLVTRLEAALPALLTMELPLMDVSPFDALPAGAIPATGGAAASGRPRSATAAMEPSWPPQRTVPAAGAAPEARAASAPICEKTGGGARPIPSFSFGRAERGGAAPGMWRSGAGGSAPAASVAGGPGSGAGPAPGSLPAGRMGSGIGVGAASEGRPGVELRSGFDRTASTAPPDPTVRAPASPSRVTAAADWPPETGAAPDIGAWPGERGIAPHAWPSAAVRVGAPEIRESASESAALGEASPSAASPRGTAAGSLLDQLTRTSAIENIAPGPPAEHPSEIGSRAARAPWEAAQDAGETRAAAPKGRSAAPELSPAGCDPEELADLINDVLMEQARRNGVDLS